MKKIIGMVLESTFPPDIRVEKEVKELVKKGYLVHLLCLKEKNKPVKEEIDGLVVHRLVEYHNKLHEYVIKTLAILTFVNLSWKPKIKQYVEDNNIQYVHVHDLPLVNTAVSACADFSQVKVIADLHENYPAAVEQWGLFDKGIKRLFSVFINNYRRWSAHEATVLLKVDHIIAVVEEMQERLLKAAKISGEKVTVVSNYEGADFVEQATIDQKLIDRYQGSFNVLYIGGFGPHRGLDTAIGGMAYLKGMPIKLLLVGKGKKVVEDSLHELVKKNALQDQVEFVGWQPKEKVVSYMKAASVCVVPHASNEHTDNTIPHKLFQYMMVGKPVVVSSCKPLARVVKSANSGLIFEAGDSKLFAEAIRKLYQDESLCNQYAENGINSTLTGIYGWETQGEKLVALYDSL